MPMKWTKYRGGFDVCWVGYEIGLRNWTLGISEARASMAHQLDDEHGGREGG